MITETLSLTRFNLRLRRRFLLLWIVPLLALIGALPSGYDTQYPDPASRKLAADAFRGNAIVEAMYGQAPGDGSLGQLVTLEGGALLTLLAGVMTVLLVTGLFRGPEQAGTGEFIRTMGFRPGSVPAAALATATIAGLLLGTGTSAVMIAANSAVGDLPPEGSLVLGVTVLLTVLGTAFLTAACTLFVRDPANIRRAAFGVLAGQFIIRALADSRDLPQLNWISPLGWRAIASPYDSNNWPALTILGILCLACCLGLVTVEKHREFGMALVTIGNPGHGSTRHLNGPGELRRILDRGARIGWLIPVVVLAVVLSSLLQTVIDVTTIDGRQTPLAERIFGDGGIVPSFFAYCATEIGILTAAAGVQTALHLRAEENQRTVDLIRSCGVARSAPYRSVARSSWTTVLLLVVAGTVAGLLGAVPEAADVGETTAAITVSFLAQIGPAAALTGIALLLVGASPRFGMLAWLPLIFGALVWIFGSLYDPPGWVIDLSVFNHTPTSTDISETGWKTGVMVIIGLACTIAGTGAATRREVH
ncbi:hypothetical protein OS125_07530 [Corynebacterium sp. P7003]|uniref:ABC transporter permease n=1 Tax=Corynebacterium pygosceleis TaxID=2800406 RepID=A0ABT3WYL7_9CORY|nr:hypothetical protein [Corynebacterium pygosceleis]MCX7445096.1 hypothetical protein [Corynebacterium pygosceleis]